MELAGYIKDLLYNNDQVVIPGLGLLQTRYKAAEINKSEHTIAPPSKFLVFDRTITQSDGLLAKFIAFQKSISQAEAEEYISQQVYLLKEKLNSGEVVLLEGIGYFSQENSEIRFEHEQEVNFLTESFGLSKVDYKTVEYNLTPKQNLAPKQSTEIIEHPRKRKGHVFVIIIVLLFIVVGGGIAVYLFYPDILKLIKRTPHPVVINQPGQQTDSSYKDTTRLDSLEGIIDSSTDKKNALAITSAKSKTASIYYYIIAGSFKTFERASVLAKQLEKEGWETEVIQFEPQVFRVSLGEFKNKAQALTRLEKIREVKGNDAVWLLTKKM